MLYGESEDSMRAYGGLTRALMAVVQIGPIAPVRGAQAQIEAGLAVYRNNVRSAFLRVLEDSFPVVFRLVGDGFFRYAAHEYFHAYPPRSPLVRRYGENFPDFLSGFEPASAYPYLAEVARLEIAWLEVYHAAEAAALSADGIFNRIGDAPDRAQLKFHPSLRLLSFSYPACAIWKHNREKNVDPLELQAGGESVFIVRPEAEVIVTPIDTATYLVMQALAGGARLGAAIEAAIEECPNAAVGDIVQSIATANIVVDAYID